MPMNRQQRRAAAKAGKLAVGKASQDFLPARRDALLAEAARAYQAGRFRESSALCRQLFGIDRRDAAALHLTGLLALQAGRNDAAVGALTAAIQVTDQVPDLHAALAEAHSRLGQVDEAITHYQRALALDPSYLDARYNYGNLLLNLRRYDEALGHYDRALALAPQFAEAFNNRGSALLELGRPGEALADFERALAIKPDLVAALANRGTALIELKQHDEGIASCTAASGTRSRLYRARWQIAGMAVLFMLRRYIEGVHAHFWTLSDDRSPSTRTPRERRSITGCCAATGPTTRMTSRRLLQRSRPAAGRPSRSCLLNMAGSRSRCAYNAHGRFQPEHKYPAAAESIWRGERYAHERVRIAYLSADFRQHPMAYSMAKLFAAHDRSHFETIAVSFGPDPKDDFRRGLESAFDRFLDVRTTRDRDIALLLRELEIDIAIDLMGYTNNSRPAILALRPAPVQVNYIGFAGTMGAEYIDYLIADRFIIPETAQASYAEQVVYLPDTYWPTDNRVSVGEPRLARAEAGLPKDAFVYCCFNQNYKITPPVFGVWMSLLRQVDGSVLWLVRDNADAERNLRREAEHAGIAPERLVFARRVPIEEYRSRFTLADLFLDTLPFNAHTTAADALWAGLPLLTCAGSSFAARVAGSLLTAAGLPELITHSLAEYEALALSLARAPERLAAIATKLAGNRDTCPLFNTARFARHIESAYRTMWRRSQRGEPPAAFAVAPLT